MKKKFLTALLLPVAACALTAGAVKAVPASAATIPAPTTTVTAEDGGYTYNYYDFTYNSAKQKMHTIAAKPSDENCKYEFVLHHVSNGSGGYTLTRVLDIAKDYEKQTGRKVIAATNGDFFTGGKPVESYVNNGVVLQQTTSVDGNYATKNSFGWDNAGRVATGKMTETATVLQLISADGKKTETFTVDKLNAAPADGEVAIYTNGGTYTVNGAGKYTVKIDEGSIASSYPCYGTSQRTSTGEVINDKSVTVKSGNFAIVVKGDNEKSRWLYDNLTYGAKANLIKAPAGSFAGMSYVVGGWNVLVNNGVVNTNCLHGTQSDANSNADRTFFGIKEDGTMMLCTVDGRQTGTAVGMTVNKEAELAKDLGLYTVIELDGGGSTTFVLRQNDELKVVNRSSEVTSTGACRAVLNAVLLVEKAEEESEEPPVIKPPVVDPKPDDPDPIKPDPIEPDPSTGGNEEKPNESEEPKGCFSSFGAYGIAATLLAAAIGTTVIAIPKKKSKR